MSKVSCQQSEVRANPLCLRTEAFKEFVSLTLLDPCKAGVPVTVALVIDEIMGLRGAQPSGLPHTAGQW